MSIRIKSIKENEVTKENINNSFLYKDLELDVNITRGKNSQLNNLGVITDIAAIFDVSDIKNSIATAFLTSPGDKLLSPMYGMDLRRYLFEPIDEFITDSIKDDIETQLPRMEPRIELVNVSVEPNEEDNSYIIQLQINIPSLNVVGLSMNYEINSEGYYTF